MKTFSFILACSFAIFAFSPTFAADEKVTAIERLAPVYRQTLVVTDLERSLALYRDALGLEVDQIKDSSPDSYGNLFFNVPAGSQKRFAYLNGENGNKRILGLSEMPDLELELIPPVEFLSRESGVPGIETGVVDFDGHLVMFYGLKNSARP